MDILLDFQQKAHLTGLECLPIPVKRYSAYSMKGWVPKKVAEGRKQRIESAQIPITEKKDGPFL
jgi:hypothetical protein